MVAQRMSLPRRHVALVRLPAGGRVAHTAGPAPVARSDRSGSGREPQGRTGMAGQGTQRAVTPSAPSHSIAVASRRLVGDVAQLGSDAWLVIVPRATRISRTLDVRHLVVPYTGWGTAERW